LSSRVKVGAWADVSPYPVAGSAGLRNIAETAINRAVVHVFSLGYAAGAPWHSTSGEANQV
jgi:hypothetical protein